MEGQPPFSTGSEALEDQLNCIANGVERRFCPVDFARGNALRYDVEMSDPQLGEGVRRILGVDPGLNVTGYGVLEVVGGGFRVVDAGVIRTSPRQPIELRLRELDLGIQEVFDAARPREMAIEDLYTHYERPQTAILMGHARGVLCLAAARNEVRLWHYPATQIKRMLTGNGRAPKTQIQLAVQHQLGLVNAPDPPDMADALAIAMCHFYHRRVGVELR